MKHYCYILYSKYLDKYYTGQTADLEERLYRHNSAFYGNLKFTSSTNDWEIYLSIECESEQQALKIEAKIKRMKSRIYITNLKRYPEMIEKLKSNSKV